MRFDLVINMLTAMSFVDNKIVLNSNGESWRPFVHIKDVLKVFYYCIIDYDKLIANSDNKPVVLNVGRNNDNYKIIDIAKLICKIKPDTDLNFINDNFNADDYKKISDQNVKNNVDNRTYRVNFDKINKLLQNLKFDWNVETGIKDLLKEFLKLNLTYDDLYNINFYRLKKMESKLKSNHLNSDLRVNQ